MDLYNNNCKYIKDLELINSSIIGYAGDSPESQKNYFLDLQFAPAFTSVCRANDYLNNNCDSVITSLNAIGLSTPQETFGLFRQFKSNAFSMCEKLEFIQSNYNWNK